MAYLLPLGLLAAGVGFLGAALLPLFLLILGLVVISGLGGGVLIIPRVQDGPFFHG
jgi:hypothetical protein